jgi:hypothetical protein
MSLRILRIFCLLLGAGIAVQAIGLLCREDPLAEVATGIEEADEPAGAPGPPEAPVENPAAALDDSAKTGPTALSKMETAAVPGAPSTDPAGKPTAPRTQTPAALDRYRAIERSGIFGAPPSAPPRPQPGLLGIANDCAIIRLPGGQVELFREGAELEGIKVLRIGTNRVLIEFKGRMTELIIFSGLGSGSLLPQEKEQRQ